MERTILDNTVNDGATLARVEALVNASDIAAAVEMAQAALADGMVHPLLLYLRAYWFSEQGRDAEASNDLKEAIRLAPQDANIYNTYGQILVKLQKPLEAAAAFENAISLAPEFSQAHCNLGCVREGLGEIEAAEQCFKESVRTDPKAAPAWAKLAGLASRRGEYAQAHVLADRALSIDPKLHLATQMHATAAIAEGDLARAEALLLGTILNDPSLSPVDRAVADCSLGDLRHAQGRYDEAYAAYSRRASEQYAIYAPVFEPPGRETSFSYGVWLADYFEKVEAADWSVKKRRRSLPPDARDGAVGHVFLVGFPRSGTTLIENILASHPGIVALEERETLYDATVAFLSDVEGRSRLEQITPKQIEEHRALYWRNVRRYGAEVEGKIFVDRYPLNSMKLPILARLFPDARILFLIRDPRDVVLSCFRRMFSMNSSTFEFLSLERTARFYDVVMRLREVYRQKLEMDWQDLRLEDLVKDFEGSARATCAFIGIDWDSRMQDFSEIAKTRRIGTPSATQVIRGLNREGIGVWRNYQAHMAGTFPTLAHWIEKFGYAE